MSIPARITPSITNSIVTAGRVYEPRPCRELPTTEKLCEITDNLGHRRIISLPLGPKCPHLKPNLGVRPRTFHETLELDRMEWEQAGHWKEVS